MLRASLIIWRAAITILLWLTFIAAMDTNILFNKIVDAAVKIEQSRSGPAARRYDYPPEIETCENAIRISY